MSNNTPENWKIITSGDSGIEKLHREFRFKNFSSAFSFMTQVAMIAERLQHHPEWYNVYNIVIIDLYRHVKGDITEKDIKFAREVNKILGEN